jgi:PAS domain S-box-containing protein
LLSLIGEQALQPTKVLLVDDDKNYYSLVQKMLARQPHKYKLEWVSSYEMARAVSQKAQYDVYLIDYRLGQRDGLQLMRDLQEQGITAPIIIMTVYGENDFDLQAIEAGAADYIDKADLKPNTLTRTIRYAVQRSRDLRALRDSEENYRILLEDASDGIVILDAKGYIEIVSSRTSELAGRPREALLGCSLAEILRPINGSKPLELDELQTYETLLTEQNLIRPDGTSVPVEISAKRVGDYRIQCIIRDITQRKQMDVEQEKYIQRLTILQQIDEELNDLLNIENVMSLALDAAVRLSGANAGFIATVDNNNLRIEQAIGQYSQIRSGDYLPNSSIYMPLIERREAHLILDSNADNSFVSSISDTRALMLIPLVSYERILGILNLETNKPDRFNQETFDFLKLIASRVAVAIENVQLYQIAQDQLAQVQELYTQVSELEKLKTDMIRIAAHDLRNPVGVIVGYLELLEWSLADKLSDKQKSQFEAMMRSAHRMEKITTDILSLERIEKLHLDKTQKIELSGLVMEVYEDYQMQAEQKHQQISLITTEEHLEIQADSAQIREAMANLISNAIKYTSENGRIDVRLAREKAYAVFEVVDNGFGIPADQQARLFQPFFRATSEETVKIDGTGLGLHLVKNIITRHGGEMIFNSVYGKGSSFGFRLPLAI